MRPTLPIPRQPTWAAAADRLGGGGGDHLRCAEGMQDGRDLDRPVLLLVVLEDRDDRAADGDRGAVERGDRLGLARLALVVEWPVARVEPAGLEVGRVRARRQLAPPPLA